MAGIWIWYDLIIIIYWFRYCTSFLTRLTMPHILWPDQDSGASLPGTRIDCSCPSLAVLGHKVSSGGGAMRSNPGCHDLPRRTPTTWLLQGCAFYHLSCSMLPISYNYCQCRCPLQHCIDVIYRKIYQIYKMDLCGRCSGNHVALKGILSYKLLPALYISVYHVCRLSPKLFSELFLCLRPAWFRIAGVEQPSVERNLVKRRSLCGAFWQASISAAGVFSTGWFNYGASHQSVGHSNILNILFGQNMKWLPGIIQGGFWFKAKQFEKTHLHHTEPYLLMLRHPLLEAENSGHVSSSKQPGGGWDDKVINVVWHDQELSINHTQPVLFSNLFKERRSKIWFVSVCSLCFFYRLARTTHGSAPDQRGTSRAKYVSVKHGIAC